MFAGLDASLSFPPGPGKGEGGFEAGRAQGGGGGPGGRARGTAAPP